MINKDLKPLVNPALAALELSPARFKHPPTAQPVLQEALDFIRETLEVASLPDAVKRHPNYALFKEELGLPGNEKKDFHKKSRNLARYLPHRSNEPVVQEKIAGFAEKVLVTMEEYSQKSFEVATRLQALSSIQKTINHLVRKNQITVGKDPIFYLGKSRRGSNVMKSTLDIKEEVKNVKARVEEGSLSPEKALVAVLHKLGAISSKELRSRSKRIKDSNSGMSGGGAIDVQDFDFDDTLNEELMASLKWASDHAFEKMEWINKLINHYLARGQITGDFERPSLNEDLRLADGFEMLCQLFFDPETDHRDGNDIQIILNDALIHWTWERAFKGRKNKRFREVERTVLDTLCKKNPAKPGKFATLTDKGAVLRYVDGEESKFEVLESREGQQLYEVKSLHCPKGQEIQLYSYRMGPKPTESGVGKHLDDDQGNLIPENVSDFFRTRFVLWKLDSKTIMADATLRKKNTDMLKKVAEDLDLQDVKIKDPKDGDKFIKWQLTGKTMDGIPIEVQLVPYDMYLFEHADNSGVDHEDYSELREINRWRVKIPPSVSPVLHQALDFREAELEAKRKRTKTAMENFDLNLIRKAA